MGRGDSRWSGSWSARVNRFDETATVLLTLPGSLWILSGIIPGSVPIERVVHVPRSGVGEIDIDLTFAAFRETGRLEFRLRDAREQPVLDYGVDVQLALSRAHVTGFRASDCDRDGLSPPLSPGRYRMTVRPGPPPSGQGDWSICPGLSFCFPFERIVEVRSAETTRLECELRTGGRLRVRVELPDRDEGIEIRGAGVRMRPGMGKAVEGNVWISPRGDVLERRYGTLTSGRSAILQTLLEPGAYEATFTAEGYQPAQGPVAINAGEYSEVVFRLAKE